MLGLGAKPGFSSYKTVSYSYDILRSYENTVFIMFDFHICLKSIGAFEICGEPCITHVIHKLRCAA